MPYGYVIVNGVVQMNMPVTITDPLVLADAGTVGAPSFSFTVDPDTGMYRFGDGVVGIAANGQIGLLIGDHYAQINGATSGNIQLSTEAVGGNFLRITGNGAGSGLNLMAGNPGSGASRNWALVTNFTDYGVIELLESTTNSGTGLATTKMTWSTGAVFVPADTIWFWKTRCVIGSSADNALQIGPNSGVTGVTLNTATDGTLLVKNFANNANGQFAAASVRGAAVAFASLPATPVEGMIAAVTNSSTVVWGATADGAGANHVLVYYNGTNWTVIGK